MYNAFSSYSFPFNQAVYRFPHQVFTRREYHFLSYERANKESKGNDKTTVLLQVRGLVCSEGYRQPSDRMSIVQKPALDQTEKEQNKRKNRIQSQLIHFHLQFHSTTEVGTVGWIRLHRSIQTSRIWEDKPFSMGHAWVDMLLRATYEEKRFVLKRGVKINLQRGQFACSSRELASDWGWSKDKVHRFFELLKSETMIETVENKITTVISITNYTKYQPREPLNEPLTSHSRATQFSDSSQQVNSKGVTQTRFFNTNEERNKERENGSLSEKSREPEAEPVKVRAKAKLVV